MSNFDGVLNPAAGWPDIPQASTSMVVLGGAGGPLNEQATQLAARTKKLKEDIENIPPTGFGGQYKNLVVTVSGVGYQGTITAERLVVESEFFATTVLRGVNLSFDAATVGAGGLDAGSITNNTWYYIYIIYNETSAAAILSISQEAPALPSGYAKFARVGAAYSAVGAFRSSTKLGRFTRWGVNDECGYVVVLSGSGSLSRVPVSTAAAHPPTAVVVSLSAVMVSGGIGTSSICFSSSSDPFVYISGAGSSQRVETNIHNSEIYYYTSNVGAGLYLSIFWYEDSV